MGWGGRKCTVAILLFIMERYAALRRIDMEIERKFLVKCIPDQVRQYPCRRVEQAYLCTQPVVRVRRYGEEFWLTCKGEGLLSREEFELPLSEEAYRHLLAKADGLVIERIAIAFPLSPI